MLLITWIIWNKKNYEIKMKINLLLLTINNILIINCFNFDIKFPIVKKLTNQIDAYFGYSIVQHYVKNENKY
jgi:hypothetical protein